ncbi:hypothetical protein E9232_006561 [Inquilinus ginsengisoli]|uniref:Uncharacterized protein n=1 Tax=Inquilinus ginsengisoli TaxID=363840 RepID=A0ABU1JZF4_9PROT|nr:hypothetical protein [Inquilinus ginsengisoli]MDR6294007.1 hypothetical protein [Inquilinus ginsengisoli]
MITFIASLRLIGSTAAMGRRMRDMIGQLPPAMGRDRHCAGKRRKPAAAPGFIKISWTSLD